MTILKNNIDQPRYNFQFTIFTIFMIKYWYNSILSLFQWPYSHNILFLPEKYNTELFWHSREDSLVKWNSP